MDVVEREITWEITREVCSLVGRKKGARLVERESRQGGFVISL